MVPDPEGPNEEGFELWSPKCQSPEVLSCSLPLDTGRLRPLLQVPGLSAPASSTDSDSDYELCPEITLTCAEEFSDDDLTSGIFRRYDRLL